MHALGENLKLFHGVLLINVNKNKKKFDENVYRAIDGETKTDHPMDVISLVPYKVAEGINI